MTESESESERGNARREFERKLWSLVEYANDQGLDIDRNWTCRTENGPDWEAAFVRLEETDD